MARFILWPDVGFNLDDLPREDTTIDHPNEILADQ